KKESQAIPFASSSHHPYGYYPIPPYGFGYPQSQFPPFNFLPDGRPVLPSLPQPGYPSHSQQSGNQDIQAYDHHYGYAAPFSNPYPYQVPPGISSHKSTNPTPPTAKGTPAPTNDNDSDDNYGRDKDYHNDGSERIDLNDDDNAHGGDANDDNNDGSDHDHDRDDNSVTTTTLHSGHSNSYSINCATTTARSKTAKATITNDALDFDLDTEKQVIVDPETFYWNTPYTGSNEKYTDSSNNTIPPCKHSWGYKGVPLCKGNDARDFNCLLCLGTFDPSISPKDIRCLSWKINAPDPLPKADCCTTIRTVRLLNKVRLIFPDGHQT
ncbi:hypothetical protein BGZ46_004431, partial [Entomortierella lignicola]